MTHYHVVSRVAIYFLAVTMMLFGLFYLVNPRDMMLYIPEFIPGGIIWTYFVGVSYILVGISFILNKWVKFTGYFMAAMLFIFIVVIHIPNYMNAGSVETRTLALINLLNASGFLGFTVHIAAGAHHQQLHLEESD